MSVLVKGMEMPERCEDCRWINHDNTPNGAAGCELKYLILLRKQGEDRPSWCPLIEIPPHGRLIDADALAKTIAEHVYPVADYFNSRDYGMFWTGGIEKAINEQSTIIEAEE